MTLDELIVRLTEIREKVEGDTEVRIAVDLNNALQSGVEAVEHSRYFVGADDDDGTDFVFIGADDRRIHLPYRVISDLRQLP